MGKFTSFKNKSASIFQSIANILILILVISCAPMINSVLDSELTFSNDQFKNFPNYIGTLEGRLVDKKNQSIPGVHVAADLEQYVNLHANAATTDKNGQYSIDIFWIENPLVLVDIYPEPANSSFTSDGIHYLKLARTVQFDIPVIGGKQKQLLQNHTLNMYSISFILKKIADDVINSRLTKISFNIEDYHTGFPIVGSTITLTPSKLQPGADQLLGLYISQESFVQIAQEYAIPFSNSTNSRTLTNDGSVEFVVMNYAYYQIDISHPEYYSVTENFYIEKSIDKVIKVSNINQPKIIDIIDN